MIRLSLHLAFGLHRWSFRLSGLHEALRVVSATLAGTAVFVTVFYFLQTPGPPRSVLAMEFFLTASLVGAFRFSPRFAHDLAARAVRARARASRERTLIVGAGRAGDLLLRDLLRSDEHAYDVVGFVDDDRRKWGQWIGGRPVLGPICKLPEIARSREVEQLLFAIPRMPAERLREILAACAELKLSYKILPVSFAYLNDRVGPAALLRTCRPTTCCRAARCSFDEEELDGLVRGRRMLVTGAAGSIGSEVCRQIAAHAPGAAGARRHRREQPLLPLPPPARTCTPSCGSTRRSSTSATRRASSSCCATTGRRTSSTPPRTSTCRSWRTRPRRR